MKAMTLKQIAAACGGTLTGTNNAEAQTVKGVAIDSRKVEEGWLFLAVKGARSDGHDYLFDCYKKGAVCCIGERPMLQLKDSLQGAYIQVEDTLEALKEIAAFYRSICSATVVGITGSVGKTSTKEMIASVLSQKYKVLKTEGNFNNEIGLPLTVLRIEEDTEIAVLEMGISNFGEMHRLSKIAKPDICVLTNIGSSHLEQLKDRDGVYRAKSEIFDYANPIGTVILNGDDDKLRGIVQERRKLITFGLEETRDYHVENVKEKGMEGIDFTLCEPEKAYPVTVTIPGKHMLYNCLAAAAVGREFSLSKEEIQRGIESNVPIAGRNNRIETPFCTIIDDCYNANPVSMKASLDVLSYATGRKVAILGDMFELGEQEAAVHQEIGRYIQEQDIDVLLCTGVLSRRMAEGASGSAKSGNEKKAVLVHYYETREELQAALSGILKQGDTILVKASHGMQFAEISAWLKETYAQGAEKKNQRESYRMDAAITERFQNIEPMIGKTPLLELIFTYRGTRRRIFAKAEYYNLTGNIKDRVAWHILQKAYEKGTLKPGDRIAEATSGNTGIAFSALGSYLGHPVTIFMPDWMSRERVNLMESFGAEVVLISKEEGGFLGSIQKTKELAERGGVFLPCQFSNEENTECHYRYTGEEIVRQLELLSLAADGFVAGVGTGGTVMGVGKRLREKNPSCRVYPLEPANSPTLSTGYKTGSHNIQGISDEFIPEIVKLKEIDEVVAVDDMDSVLMARMLSEQLGIGVGISSGANFLGCVKKQEELGADTIFATTFADDNKKYLSTVYAQKPDVKPYFISAQIQLEKVIAHRMQG